MLKPDPLAYPPRGMSHEQAARYIGVGATLFDEMVRDGRMPKPTRINKRIVWDRHKIDEAFEELTRNAAPRNILDEMLQNGGQFG